MAELKQPAVALALGLLTAKEVGTLLGLSARSIYDIPEAELPRYRLGAGGGAVRFDRADVQAYLASCRHARPAPSLGPAARATISQKSADPFAYFRAAGVKPKPEPSAPSKARKAAPYVRRS